MTRWCNAKSSLADIQKQEAAQYLELLFTEAIERFADRAEASSGHRVAGNEAACQVASPVSTVGATASVVKLVSAIRWQLAGSAGQGLL